VRDIYDIGDKLLIVATDRLSAFDVILPTPIPDKGRVLTQLSLFWFDLLRDVIPTMCLARRNFLRHLTIIVKNWRSARCWCARRCRSRLNAWCGATFPGRGGRIIGPQDKFAELRCLRLTRVRSIAGADFHAGYKSRDRHDENISFERAASLVGNEHARQVRDVSLEIYRRAATYAEPRGILLADTKFEFGLLDDELIWIDEALTPDSSRFWPAAQYEPGGPQPSFDKQFVRDYLESIHWPKTPPGPELPPEVVAATRGKYREAYRILTGRELD